MNKIWDPLRRQVVCDNWKLEISIAIKNQFEFWVGTNKVGAVGVKTLL